MSLIAHTVSSMGVSGSARWQYNRSTKSTPRRSSDAAIAWSRYLRLSVWRMLGTSWMPQYSFVDSTYSWRFQPSEAMASPMMRSDSPPA